MIDDRSTDKSVEIIKKFSVKLITKRKRKAKNPVAETINLGIRHAGGRYIALIEGDIRVEKACLVKLLSNFKEKGLGIVSGYIMVLPTKSWINKLFYLLRRRVLLNTRKGNKTVNREIFPRMGFLIFRSDVFESVGLFDETISATDLMLYLKAQAHGYNYLCDLSAIAYDIRGYTLRKLIQTFLKQGIAMYQTGGSLLYMHEQLLFRYIILAPHYCLTLFRYGKSLISLLFPVYSLMRYVGTIVGYLGAFLKKEPKCPEYLRKKRKESEIRWMLNSFRKKFEDYLRN